MRRCAAPKLRAARAEEQLQPREGWRGRSRAEQEPQQQRRPEPQVLSQAVEALVSTPVARAVTQLSAGLAARVAVCSRSSRSSRSGRHGRRLARRLAARVELVLALGLECLVDLRELGVLALDGGLELRLLLELVPQSAELRLQRRLLPRGTRMAPCCYRGEAACRGS